MADESFGKYTIKRQLGSGGMADVFQAHDPMLDRDVAIKVIHPYLSNDEEFEKRFRREAKAVASLRHPNIVQVYEFELANGAPFMVMEYLGGGTLKDRLAEFAGRGETMPVELVNKLLLAIGSALDHAHARGLVHRDLKPANILFSEGGDPVITDFGIAKILSDTSQLTMTGKLLGTPAYMSPEQASGSSIDKRSDIYSLGIILFQMLCGTVPFKGDSTTGVMMQHLTQPPPSLRQFNPAISDQVQAVVLKALAKSPDDRYSSAGEMASALNHAVTAPAQEAAGTSADEEGETLIEGEGTDTEEKTLIKTAGQTAKPATATRTPVVTKQATPAKPASQAKPKEPAAGPAGVSAPGAVGALASIQRLGTRGLVIAGGVLVLLLLLGGLAVAKLANLGQPETLGVGITPAAGSASSQGKTPASSATMPGSSAATTPDAGMQGMDSGTPAAGALPSFGLIRFADGVARADQVVVTLTGGLPAPAAGKKYEAWLVGKQGEHRTSLGKIDVDSKGKGQVTYVDRGGANLLAEYDTFELTLEPDPDDSPLSSGDVVASSAIPPGSLMHIQHLLVAYDDTPKNIGFAVGLLQDAKLLTQISQDMLDSNQKNDFERVSIDAEEIVNIVEGKQGQHYGDLDKNGATADPSDGYGLLLNGKQDGYISGTIDHADLAAKAADATAEIKMHTEHVTIAAKNVETWATQLRDLALKVLVAKDSASAQPSVRSAAALANTLLNGIDIDGDMTVDPIQGEAGALFAYEYSFHLADMPILKGANQMPPPAPK